MAAREKEVGDYRYEDATRLNNPTAALAREDVAPIPERTFSFDPYLDPQLMWAGKSEQQELDVEAPSIHVHERLSTEAVVKAARRENAQIALFADPGLDRATQVEFYEHEMGWANRLILGDSLRVPAKALVGRQRRRAARQVGHDGTRRGRLAALRQAGREVGSRGRHEGSRDGRRTRRANAPV